MFYSLMKRTAALALLFTLAYNLLFFQTQIGIGTGVFFLTLNIYFFLLRNPRTPNLRLALFSSFMSTLFGLLCGFRANEVVRGINLGSAGLFALVSLYLYKIDQKFERAIRTYLLAPLGVIKDTVLTIFSFFDVLPRLDAQNDKSAFVALIRGALVATPLVGVLFLLLFLGDPLFGTITKHLFQDLGERVVVSFFVLLSTLLLGLSVIKKISEKSDDSPLRPHKFHELSVILGSVVILFSLYIAVQFRYLFSAVSEQDLELIGIQSLTYREYVRKGFFELLAASSIASLLIVYVLQILYKLQNKQKKITQLLILTLTFLTGLILLSAARRLNLYSEAHGLTRARIFGMLGLFWLSSLLVIFFVQVFARIRQKWIFSLVVGSICVFLVTNSIVNIDRLIAIAYKPTVNGEIDYYYLANLSPDAYPSWQQAVLDADKTINRLSSIQNLVEEDNRQLLWASWTLTAINRQLDSLQVKYDPYDKLRKRMFGNIPRNIAIKRKWQSWNFGEYQAYQFIVANEETFQKIPQLQARIKEIADRVTPIIRQNTPIDRDRHPPLLYDQYR